ncbi:MAG TPA: cupredoxin domain-containing protein [Candidatus Saccharimonadales bacterium]|jgi:plastocyanin|nr:cupredoxin domain-containing protein [Candidatus Saccharimonadales bacterium]
MDKKLMIGVIVAVLAIGGIGVAVLLNKKDTTNKTADMSHMGTSQNSTPSAQSSTPESKPTEQNNPNPTDQVKIENFTFSPVAITVKKGTTVTWTNKDSAAHTVTADKGEQGPASGSLQQGGTYTFTYNTVGTFAYHCNFHANMTGSVVVTE